MSRVRFWRVGKWLVGLVVIFPTLCARRGRRKVSQYATCAALPACGCRVPQLSQEESFCPPARFGRPARPVHAPNTIPIPRPRVIPRLVVSAHSLSICGGRGPLWGIAGFACKSPPALPFLLSLLHLFPAADESLQLGGWFASLSCARVHFKRGLGL